jgi:hypothetical protein
MNWQTRYHSMYMTGPRHRSAAGLSNLLVYASLPACWGTLAKVPSSKVVGLPSPGPSQVNLQTRLQNRASLDEFSLELRKKNTHHHHIAQLALPLVIHQRIEDKTRCFVPVRTVQPCSPRPACLSVCRSTCQMFLVHRC